MKYLRQFTIILFIAFLGEGIRALIPLPIPASVYGLVLLFLSLTLGWIPLDAVKDTGKFLIEIMPVMFIPAAVRITDSWNALRPYWTRYLTVTILSLFAVMLVTGRVTQWMIQRESKKEENRE